MPDLRSLALTFVLTVTCAAQQPAPDQSGTTLHASARLVIVDVTVTDKQGHPIHGLKQTDFSLLESKKPQTIRSFEEHAAPDPAQKPKPTPQLPPGVFTNDTAPPAAGAINILLLDTLNTPMQDQSLVRQQLLNLLSRQRPNVNVAIFGLTSRLLLLQDFTSDPEALKQAVTPRKNLATSPLLGSPVSGVDTGVRLSDRLTMSHKATPQSIARAMEFEATQQSANDEDRVRLTLEAMNQLARYLSGIPGRKNLIWFSGSFPVMIGPDPTLQMDPAVAATKAISNHNAGVASSADEFRQTINLFSRSQVAVYPVYAHGLAAQAMFSTELGGVNRNRAASSVSEQDKAFTQHAADHFTMESLADETGGIFGETNDLAGAAERAIEHGANYYTLAYTPGNDHWKGEYRSIKVNLEQKGYTLGYRRGYLADDPNALPSKSKAVNVVTNVMSPGPMQLATKFAAPPATQILFKVRALPDSDAVAEQAAPGNTLNPDPARTRPPYRNYAIDYLAETSAIQFEHTPDGHYRDDLEYVTCVYDLNGELIDIVTNDATISFTAAQYGTLMQRGLPYRLLVSVPVKGEYLLRVALHDLKTDRIGSVEFPVDAIKALPPIQAQK